MVRFHSIVCVALLNTRIVSINCWQMAAHVSYLLEHYIRVHSLGRGGSFEVRYLVRSTGQAVVFANFFALDCLYTCTTLFRVQWAYDWIAAFCCLSGLLLSLRGNEFLLKSVLKMYICYTNNTSEIQLYIWACSGDDMELLNSISASSL